jgi:hypothetical protein
MRDVIYKVSFACGAWNLGTSWFDDFYDVQEAIRKCRSEAVHIEELDPGRDGEYDERVAASREHFKL